MTTPANDPTPAAWTKRAWVRLAVVAVVVAAVVGVVWLRPREFRPRRAAISDVLARSPVALAPGVYLLGKASPAAVYLVETSEGLVLIDSGLEANAAGVLAQLGELRFDVKHLRAILLTHVHADHSMGAVRLRELSGAKIYAGRADAQALRQGAPREMFFSTFHMPQLTPHRTTVDVELVGDETLAFGKTRFVVLATPGHTPGSVCYLLERADLSALFTGDIVQNLTRPAGGEMGTYAAALAPHFGGSARDYLHTLRRLRGLPVPSLVLPGHPRMDLVPQSPRLSERQWHALLDVGIAELETLISRYEKDGADFLDGTPRELLPGLHYLGNLGHVAVYVLASSKGLFVFNAPSGAVELLSKRFQTGPQLTAVLLTSADEEITAGLAALVRQTGCQVVAAKAAAADIQRRCPPDTKLLTEDDLAMRDWFDVQTLALPGRGVAPLAYRLRWSGKTVLVSGRIPVKPSGPALEELEADLSARGNVADYVASLRRLAQLRPDVWLPAIPVHGQNANLYDREWEAMLDANRRFLKW